MNKLFTFTVSELKEIKNSFSSVRFEVKKTVRFEEFVKK